LEKNKRLGKWYGKSAEMIAERERLKIKQQKENPQMKNIEMEENDNVSASEVSNGEQVLTEEQLEKMSIKDMKQWLMNKGVSYADCFEKGDLKLRIRETLKTTENKKEEKEEERESKKRDNENVQPD